VYVLNGIMLWWNAVSSMSTKKGGFLFLTGWIISSGKVSECSACAYEEVSISNVELVFFGRTAARVAAPAFRLETRRSKNGSMLTSIMFYIKKTGRLGTCTFALYHHVG
jgi:hypothetical protein